MCKTFLTLVFMWLKILLRCRRLSLTPLCYLWQRDQAELLTEMTEAGLEAIIIKVAGAGLVPKHLGKTLTELRPTLMKLVRMVPVFFFPLSQWYLLSSMIYTIYILVAKEENTRL